MNLTFIGSAWAFLSEHWEPIVSILGALGISLPFFSPRAWTYKYGKWIGAAFRRVLRQRIGDQSGKIAKFIAHTLDDFTRGIRDGLIKDVQATKSK